jgi:hypothetical protein
MFNIVPQFNIEHFAAKNKDISIESVTTESATQGTSPTLATSNVAIRALQSAADL